MYIFFFTHGGLTVNWQICYLTFKLKLKFTLSARMLLMKNVIKCWRVLCLVVMLFSAFFFFCFSERFVCISHTRFCQSDTPNYLYLALIPQPHNGTLQDFLWPSHQHREHGMIVEYISVWNTNWEILTYSKHLITKFDWKDVHT